MPSWFAKLDRRSARAVLLLLLVVTVGLVAAAVQAPRESWEGCGQPGQGDVALFRAIVDRVSDGDGYYLASAQELHDRGYPTQSVFNWRMPLPLALIGHLPDPVLGKALLGLLALCAAAFSFEALAREDGNHICRAVMGVLLLGGPLMFCVIGDLFVMPVVWCGTLVALSVACYGLDRPRGAVVLGVAALAVRELALPYCLLMLALAAWQRRREEATTWVVGLAGWTIYFTIHASMAVDAMPADGLAHTQSWIRFGGLPFVLATSRMNGYLMALPNWATALYLAASLFGLAGWNTPWGRRVALAACGYAAAFAVAGQEFNAYWGCVAAPLWCLGAARFPGALRDAWRAADGFGVRRFIAAFSIPTRAMDIVRAAHPKRR